MEFSLQEKTAVKPKWESQPCFAKLTGQISEETGGLSFTVKSRVLLPISETTISLLKSIHR